MRPVHENGVGAERCFLVPRGSPPNSEDLEGRSHVSSSPIPASPSHPDQDSAQIQANATHHTCLPDLLKDPITMCVDGSDVHNMVHL